MSKQYGSAASERHDRLVTQRLILAPARRSDASDIAHIADNARIAENLMRLPHPYREVDALDWIERASREDSESRLIIRRKKDGALIGAIGCQAIAEAPPELGYWVGEPFWGKGYATEAAQHLLDRLFAAGGIPVIAATCRVTNRASRRVLAKCGFQHAGQDMNHSRFFGGPVPVECFRLERSIWRSLRQWRSRPSPDADRDRDERR